MFFAHHPSVRRRVILLHVSESKRERKTFVGESENFFGREMFGEPETALKSNFCGVIFFVEGLHLCVTLI